MTTTPESNENSIIDSPAPDPEKATSRRSAYLPVLPEGWEYEVALRGPNGARVLVDAAEPGEFTIRYIAGDGTMRHGSADKFADAVKTAANGARLMDKVHRLDAEARQAREEALSVLGEEEQSK